MDRREFAALLPALLAGSALMAESVEAAPVCVGTIEEAPDAGGEEYAAEDDQGDPGERLQREVPDVLQVSDETTANPKRKIPHPLLRR